MKKAHLTLLLGFFFFVGAFAQNEEATNLNEASPLAKTFQIIGLTDIEVVYSRPSVKGRNIWGALVPDGEIWRAGANNITSISFSTDVTIEGKPMQAGTYGLFVLPEKDKWTFVFNSNLRGFGTFFYSDATDVLRLTVPVKKATTMVESLQYTFDELTFDSGDLTLAWENLQASFKIKVNKEQIIQKVFDLVALAEKEKKSDYYDMCVRWTLDHNMFRDLAAPWLETSLSMTETFSNQFTAARWNGSIGKYDEAIAYLKKAEKLAPQNAPVTQAFIKRFEKEKMKPAKGKM